MTEGGGIERDKMEGGMTYNSLHCQIGWYLGDLSECLAC